MRKFDIVIVGGGIAGLATAEMFARSGYKTLLLEKGSNLCHEASGVHHEWFHFGSLYSIFPNRQYLRTLTGGIDDLLQYYRDFDGMNLRIDGEGKLIKIPAETGWFREDNLEYVIATTDAPDFSFSSIQNARDLARKVFMRMVWNLAVKRFVCRHNRFHKYDWRRGFASHYIPKAGWRDYSGSFIHEFDSTETDLDPACHIAMRSYDSPMHAYHIVSELTRGFLSNGGRIETHAPFRRFRSGTQGVEVVTDNGAQFLAQKLILASGEALQRHSGGRIRVKSVVSPLLVAAPGVCSRNLVRLTPFMNQTINHIQHTIDGYDYSLIGGGYFAPVEDEKAIEAAGNKLLRNAKSVFPALAEAELLNLYFGIKSEMISAGAKRNYLYRVEQIEQDVYGIVPGKFSLAFSLAFTTFRDITGRYPRTYTSYNRQLDVNDYVALTKHKALVKDFVSFKSVTTSKLEESQLLETQT